MIPHGNDITKHDFLRIFALEILLAAVSGLLIHFSWERLGMPTIPWPGTWEGIPRDGVWRGAFAVGFPLVFVLFGAAYLVLGLVERNDQVLRDLWNIRGKDLWFLTALPAVLVVMFTWTAWGDWFLTLGALFVGLVFLKAGWFCLGMYRVFSAKPEGGSNAQVHSRTFKLGLVLIPFATYATLGFWINHAISTTGDEHVYLLGAHSLWADHDADIHNNIAHKDFEAFYWGAWHPGAWDEFRFVGFPLVLVPAYALGGRLGVLWFQAILTALTLYQAYMLMAVAGIGVRARFLAWVSMAATPYAFIYSTSVYPEIPAAFLILFSLRKAAGFQGKLASVIPTLAPLLAVPMLKPRYGLSSALVGGYMIRRMAARAGWGRVIPLAAGLSAAALAVVLWKSRLAIGVDWSFLQNLLTWKSEHILAALGLVFDQEYGLLAYAPVILLGVAGTGYVVRLRKDLGLFLWVLVGVTLWMVSHAVTVQWDAGWTPPTRFLISIVFPLSVFVGGFLEARTGRGWKVLFVLAVGYGVLMAFLLTLVPIWRFNNVDGAASVISALGRALGMNLYRLFPSLVNPLPEGFWFLPGVLGGAACLWIVARRFLTLGPAGISLVAGLGFIAVLFLAERTIPTRLLHAEAMQHDAGVLFRELWKYRSVWVLNASGSVWDTFVLPEGDVEVRAYVGGLARGDEKPKVRFLLGDKPVWEGALDAGATGWKEQEIRFNLHTAGGRQRLTLEFVNGTAAGGDRPERAVFVDYVAIEKVQISDSKL